MHEKLLNDVKTALALLFADTSVGPDKTRESLLDLREEIDMRLDCLN